VFATGSPDARIRNGSGEPLCPASSSRRGIAEVAIELDGADFRRIVVSLADAASVRESVAAAVR